MLHRNPLGSAFTAQTEMPLVGRIADLGALRLALDDAVEGCGQTIFLFGQSGIGKTRLVLTLAREAMRREMLIAMGAAYSVEAGLPYAMISDALVPPLRALPAATLSVLARGAERELGTILHGLTTPRDDVEFSASAEADRKARLLWNFAPFLERVAARQPLLLILENAQWSDPSSVKLLHFLAQQLRTAPCLILVTYADDEQEIPAGLCAVERSLVSRGGADVRRIAPLTRHDVAEVLYRLSPSRAIRLRIWRSGCTNAPKAIRCLSTSWSAIWWSQVGSGTMGASGRSPSSKPWAFRPRVGRRYARGWARSVQALGVSPRRPR